MAKTSVNGKSLVIVESPAKAKTINKYLGYGYEVKASMGHIRDLPAKEFGVDLEKKFEPTYAIMPGKAKVVTALKAAAKKCKDIYLATDLDREGEAIAWHLAHILGVRYDKVYRVIFNAITHSAIKQAFANPGRIDIDKVMAQQARRILDRIVGYKISPLLWKKVARGLSAGRVQSVAVKMVVLREREIRGFKPEEYWHIPAIFTTDLDKDYGKPWRDFLSSTGKQDQRPNVDEQNKWFVEHNAFKAEIYKVGDESFKASNNEQAKRVYDAVKGAGFKIGNIEKKESSSRPGPPFITSTLQQAAANRLGFSTKRTMMYAQQLYEGVDLGEEMGSLGLITYMRTDSTHISPEAIGEARRFIQRHLGDVYVPDKANVFAAQKNAQAAHEAIRPTDVDMTPQDIRPLVSEEQYKLYDLIWRRFIACQMTPAKWDVTNLDIFAETKIGRCWYKAGGRVLVFDGFAKVWPVPSTDQQLPTVTAGQTLAIVDINAEQHFTKPPARYTEASLVKALEKEGIGRPSTYAAIISTILDRDYVEQKEKKLFATDLGEVVTDKLDQYFPEIMDVAFTRYMEEQLDKIEEQHLDWVRVLSEFYGPFKKSLDTAMTQMQHAKAETTPSDYECPHCGEKLVYRFGRNGKFLSCSAYPKCKFTWPCDKDGKMVEHQVSEHKCPICGKPMIHRKGRFGAFLGCSDYPNCKSIVRLDKQGNIAPPKPPPEPTGIKCYKCKEGQLVIRQSRKGPFLGCNRYPKCRTIVNIKQKDQLIQLQAQGLWPPRTPEEADKILEKTSTRSKSQKKTRASTGYSKKVAAQPALRSVSEDGH
ncbi:MAG: type I DNA topoisomerase [Sedimentisphaerales bacterium]|nr:type I DNA topoisomerase [Sedimentisphaerales bacterium]